MKVLSYIPISMYVIVNAVYDFFHTSDSTHWSIFYFVGIYLSLLLWTIREALSDLQAFLFFGSLGLGISIRMKIEIDKWNLPYEQYRISISDLEGDILIASLTIAVLLVVVHKIWNK